MTLTGFSDYSELFRGCIWYSDGSLNGSYLANLMNIATYGTKVGSPTITGSDRFEKSNKTLNGFTNSNYWTIPYSVYNSYTNISMGIWVKFPITTPSTYPTILGKSNNTEYKYILLHLQNSGYITWVDHRTTSVPGGIMPITHDGNWHFITAHSDGTNATNCMMYLDGEFKLQCTTSAASKKGTWIDIQLGCDTFYSRPYTESIGELFIYNRLISAAEIKALYALTSKKYLYPVQNGIRSCE